MLSWHIPELLFSPAQLWEESLQGEALLALSKSISAAPPLGNQECHWQSVCQGLEHVPINLIFHVCWGPEVGEKVECKQLNVRHRDPAKAVMAATCALKAETFIHVLQQSSFEPRLMRNGLPTDGSEVNKYIETSVYTCPRQVSVISWPHWAL